MKTMYRKSMVTLAAVTMLATAGSGAAQAAGVGVALDNKALKFQMQPYLQQGQTMVQLRTVVEALGGKVTWEAEKQQVRVELGDDTGFVRIGGTMLVVNDQTFTLSVPAELRNGATMVPVRLLERFGVGVKWNAAQNRVELASNGHSMSLSLALNGEIESMDPAKATTPDAFSLIAQTQEGLVRLDKTGRVEAGVADQWQVSPDGKTYTFHLRPAAKWSNGSQVKAKDFEYAWKRVLDPHNSVQWAFLMMDLEGALDFNSGKQTADAVGVKALDDRTLQVKLQHPVPYFLEQVAHPVFYPVNMAFVDQIGEQHGQDPDKVLSNGPFKLTEWEHEGMMKLVKNEHYWDAQAVKLDTVHYTIVNDLVTSTSLYRQGVIDRLQLNEQEFIDLNKGTPEYSTLAEGTTHYLSFNTIKNGLNNKLVRKALTYAIETSSIAGIQGDSAPATGFVPTGITDHLGGEFRKKGVDQIAQQDNVTKAKAILAEGLKQLGRTELPPMTLLVDDSMQKRKIADRIAADWKQNLGVEIKVEAVPFKIRLQRTQEDNFDIALMAWQGDYNDAGTFLDMWETHNYFNASNYSNPEYDELIQQSDLTPDMGYRTKLLSQAETLLLDDMPVVPLYFNNKSYLTKPYVKGLATHSFGFLYDLKQVYVEGRN
ncbi:oligopeptide transport system substrate-binding protein [Tumebacillus sp. BK434]|uniref:ABC transporter substrate-binding protein n=1 Tax=Tumebacillus sp. BK434 TaxID=2512169 RepID=UPI00105286BB|nr:ABC transporter substrate-binding protein [Tumebacillus sp. BK434]TCP55864.1 oligopeptide transport system substrate-binding protein [Tumebacillus sp. BK434]